MDNSVSSFEAAKHFFIQGVSYFENEDYKNAEAAFLNALQLMPGRASTLNNLAATQIKLGKYEEALKNSLVSINIESEKSDAWLNCGLANHRLNNFYEALAHYDQAIRLSPDYAEAWSNKGNTLDELQRYAEALVNYDKAICINPDYAEAWSNKGGTLKKLERYAEALSAYDKAIALNPDYAEAYSNRGNAYLDLGRLDEAMADYNRAIALKPEYAETYSNRGNAYLDLGRLDEAMADYNRAIALKPEYAEANWNKAILEIKTGNYRSGWMRYEWRWKVKNLKLGSPRAYPQPLWLGDELLAGRRLLIWPEQGLGDYLQCVRYAGLAVEQGAQVILEAPASLVPLLETLPWPVTLIESGQALPPFDYHTPVMSLPLAFKTELASIPAAIPYLHAEEDKRRDWQQRLGDKTKSRIGLVWSGSTGHKKDIYRSMNPATLLPLLELPFEFHCLQKEIRPADEEMLKRHPQVQVHCDVLEDFSDTAALAQAMDVVISVDTSLAHLAGAMGKAVWILLPFAPDYRWLLDREDSPWYPTARLFQQKTLGDWASVVSALKQQLERSLREGEAVVHSGN